MLRNLTFILFLCLASFCGCDGGLLQETPDTFDGEAEVFSTEAGVDAAVNGLYYSFSEGDYHGAAFHNLLMPMSGKFWSSQASNIDAAQMNLNPSNPSLNQLWSQTYQTINEANIIISNLETGNTGLSNRESALGEAYFLRAVTYFDLVRMFGGVPLRTEPTQVETLNLPRESAEAVYAQIVADLETARDLLPAVNPGRQLPSAATAYLAKLYLTRATTENDASYLSLAKEAALAVVNSGDYALVPTYAELFQRGNENTTESIFELQYGFTGGVRVADFSRIYTPRGSIWSRPNVPTFGRVRPNKETFDKHVAEYPDDPRIDAIFLYGSYERNGSTRTIYPTRTRGNDGFPAMRKYFDENYNGTTTESNMILLRYADVLLMLAEIENELNGPADAYQYVNQVLTRARNLGGGAGAMSPANWEAMNQDEFRSRIRRERLFELLGEGHAWFDTRRFGYDYLLNTIIIPHNTNENFDNGKDFEYVDDPKNLLLPLPQSELGGNSRIGITDQNPGY